MTNAILFIFNDKTIPSLRNLNNICFSCKNDYDIFGGFTIFDRAELLPNIVKPINVYKDLHETIIKNKCLHNYNNIYIINADLYTNHWNYILNVLNTIEEDSLVSGNYILRISNNVIKYIIDNDVTINDAINNFTTENIERYTDFKDEHDYNCINDIPNKSIITNGYVSTKDTYLLKHNHRIGVELSIVIPVFNGAKYFDEMMESILNQVNPPSYEIIIVNDGSYDETNNIVLTYNTNNIVYISKKHDGIVNSLNIGIKYANGKYIVRMDSDDIMLPNRLRMQYEYMESNINVDIASYQMISEDTLCYAFIGNPTLSNFDEGNKACHPTIIMRKSSLDKLPYLYEDYYKDAEDYKLWITSLTHGLNISCVDKPVIIYRRHDTQTSYNSGEIGTTLERIHNGISSILNHTSSNELTAIIPFRNEGGEVERTIWSIKATNPNINIILVNDGSDDNFDYDHVANLFGCKYIKNEKPIGVGYSRDLGIKNCETEYFIILDAHMRLYENNWGDRILKIAKENPKSILCAQSVIFGKVYKDCIYINEHGDDKIDNYYAHYFEYKDKFILSNWCYKIPKKYKNKNVVPVPCLIGACYISSKTWWNYIGGLQGLKFWGYDEELISTKTWLAGGSILLIRDFYAGHLYRYYGGNYPPNGNEILNNKLFISYMFYNDFNINKVKDINDDDIKRFNDNFEIYKQLKLDFENVRIHNLSWLKKMNKKYY